MNEETTKKKWFSIILKDILSIFWIFYIYNPIKLSYNAAQKSEMGLEMFATYFLFPLFVYTIITALTVLTRRKVSKVLFNIEYIVFIIGTILFAGLFYLTGDNLIKNIYFTSLLGSVLLGALNYIPIKKDKEVKFKFTITDGLAIASLLFFFVLLIVSYISLKQTVSIGNILMVIITLPSLIFSLITLYNVLRRKSAGIDLFNVEFPILIPFALGTIYSLFNGNLLFGITSILPIGIIGTKLIFNKKIRKEEELYNK